MPRLTQAELERTEAQLERELDAGEISLARYHELIREINDDARAEYEEDQRQQRDEEPER